MTKMSTNMMSSALEYVDMEMNSDMGECSDCLSETEHCEVCNAGCATPLNTLVDVGSLIKILTVEISLTDFPQNYTSNKGPPDPFPPRSSNLI